MAIFTLAEIDEQMAAYKAALLNVAKGQSYKIGQRMMTRADLPEIRSQLDWLEEKRREISAESGPVVNTARPRR